MIKKEKFKRVHMGMHVSSYSMNAYGDKEKKESNPPNWVTIKTENLRNVFIIKLVILNLNCYDGIINLII